MPRSVDDQFKVFTRTYDNNANAVKTEETWVGYGEHEPSVRMANLRLLEAICTNLATIAESLSLIVDSRK